MNNKVNHITTSANETSWKTNKEMREELAVG